MNKLRAMLEQFVDEYPSSTEVVSCTALPFGKLPLRSGAVAPRPRKEGGELVFMLAGEAHDTPSTAKFNIENALHSLHPFPPTEMTTNNRAVEVMASAIRSGRWKWIPIGMALSGDAISPEENHTWIVVALAIMFVIISHFSLSQGKQVAEILIIVSHFPLF